MNKKELLKKINKWLELSRSVKKNDKDIIVFDDEEVFKIFGGVGGVLNPFDDYTYQYFYYFLMDLREYLQNYDDKDINIILEDFQDEMLGLINKWISIYDNDLIEWLNHNKRHFEFTDKIIQEQKEFEDTISLLQQAQKLMIARVYDKALSILINHIQEQETIIG